MTHFWNLFHRLVMSIIVRSYFARPSHHFGSLIINYLIHPTNDQQSWRRRELKLANIVIENSFPKEHWKDTRMLFTKYKTNFNVNCATLLSLIKTASPIIWRLITSTKNTVQTSSGSKNYNCSITWNIFSILFVSYILNDEIVLDNHH